MQPQELLNWARTCLGEPWAAAASRIPSWSAAGDAADEPERLAVPGPQATAAARTKVTRATRPVRQRTMPLQAG